MDKVELETIEFVNKGDVDFETKKEPINATNLNQLQSNTNNALSKLQDNISKKFDDLKLKKLWENENPTLTFSPQTITLANDDYDFLVFLYSEYKTTSHNLMSQMTLKGRGVNLNNGGDFGVGGTYYVANYVRRVIYVDDTTYNVETCFVKYNGSNTADNQNDYNIPLAVYGGKF